MTQQSAPRPSIYSLGELEAQVQRLRALLFGTQIVMLAVAGIGLIDYVAPGGVAKLASKWSSQGGSVMAKAEPDGSGIGFKSPEGTTRALWFVKRDSSAALLLYDPQGNPRAEVSVLAAGPGIRFRDPNGQLRMELSVEDGESRLSMFDPSGHVVWTAP